MFNVSFGQKIPDRITDKMIFPVLSARDLLGPSRHKIVIQELKKYAQLPEEHFDAIYLKLIHHFAEFVQLIPSEPFGAMGGLLSMGLARGITAIQQFITHYGKKELDALNCYAVFSVGMLLDVSRVLVNQKVIITDKDGNFEADWKPFTGPMVGVGEHYRLREVAPAYRRLEVAINSILARQIMPEAGFIWLSSHWRVFADWLDAIGGGGAGGERIAHLFSLLKLDDLLELLKQLHGFHIDYLEPNANEHGERFFHWLRDGIDDGSIRINALDARVHVLEEGVFVDRQLFKQYADMVKTGVNIHTVFAQFGNSMGFVKMGENDYLFASFVSDSEEGAGNKVGFIGSRRSKNKAQGVRVDTEILLKNEKGVSDYIRINGSSKRPFTLSDDNTPHKGYSHD